MKEKARKKILARLRKLANQVEGIQRMVEEDRYCVYMLNQVAAVEGTLDKVGHLVLASHVDNFLEPSFLSDAGQTETLQREASSTSHGISASVITAVGGV